MNLTHDHNTKNNTALNTGTIHESTLLEALRYNSSISNQQFEIDADDNLHITANSIIETRDDIVPLDMINPQPMITTHLNKSLMQLALTSALISGAFFASALFMNQPWAVTFSILFWVFGIIALITSYKKRSKNYQYFLTNTSTRLFMLGETMTQNTQVELFIKALNKRINNLNDKSEDYLPSKMGVAHLDQHQENDIYTQNKQSQYLIHLDFLFNHGIVDDVLYKRLITRINNQIEKSENRFIKKEKTNNEVNIFSNNIINFPIDVTSN